jgi:hypothetical protein
VHLEHEPGAEPLGPQPPGEPDHRDLDDVCRRALDRHVDGHPLAGGTQRRIARGELRDVALAADERRDETLGARLLLIASM